MTDPASPSCAIDSNPLARRVPSPKTNTIYCLVKSQARLRYRFTGARLDFDMSYPEYREWLTPHGWAAWPLGGAIPSCISRSIPLKSRGALRPRQSLGQKSPLSIPAALSPHQSLLLPRIFPSVHLRPTLHDRRAVASFRPLSANWGSTTFSLLPTGLGARVVVHPNMMQATFRPRNYPRFVMGLGQMTAKTLLAWPMANKGQGIELS